MVDIREARDDVVKVVQEDVGIWGSHAAAHSRAKDLKVMFVEEGKGVVFKDVVEDKAKDLGVWSVWWEVLAIFIDEFADAIDAFIDGNVGVKRDNVCCD